MLSVTVSTTERADVQPCSSMVGLNTRTLAAPGWHCSLNFHRAKADA